MPDSRAVARLALAAACLALPAGATTIRIVSDARLVDRADVVAAVTVEAKLGVVGDRPATEWQLVVDRVLKGAVNSGRVVLSLPGGVRPDGIGLHIYGAPQIAPGGEAIVFLRQRADGSYALVDFPQGAFLGARSTTRRLLLRDFSEVRLVGAGRVGARDPMRDFDRFADWIEDRASGFRRAADYLVSPRRDELETITSPFTLFTDDTTGLRLRWFNFDSGGSVPWRTHTTGMPGLSGGGVDEFKRGIAVWNNESTTPIRLTYAGTSGATAGFESFDGQNVLVWTDPNQEIAGTYQCGAGGTLAIGGPWYDDASTRTFDGRQYHPILGGDVIFNDGIDCEKSGSPSFSEFIEEVAGHEIGHTLGIGHSSERRNEPNSTLKNALMYAFAHDDGRGAKLNSDDVKALQTLYKVGGAGGGGGGGGGGGTAGCPAGTPADTLCLLSGRFHVTGTWQNQFNGTSGAAKPIVNSNLSGFFYFSDKGNIELIIKILDFGTEIKVFYSQLTNLRFTLSVRDTLTGKTKSYANTAGDCGAIDNNFAVGSLTAESGAILGQLTAAPAGACKADSTTLCTLNNRFSTTVTWRNQFNGTSGSGTAKPLSALTGAFSFDNAANLEILIKTLEFPDRILILWGSLSNFEYTLRVTDTSTGKFKEYRNPAGQFCGGLDNAF